MKKEIFSRSSSPEENLWFMNLWIFNHYGSKYNFFLLKQKSIRIRASNFFLTCCLKKSFESDHFLSKFSSFFHEYFLCLSANEKILFFSFKNFWTNISTSSRTIGSQLEKLKPEVSSASLDLYWRRIWIIFCPITSQKMNKNVDFLDKMNNYDL